MKAEFASTHTATGIRVFAHNSSPATLFCPSGPLIAGCVYDIFITQSQRNTRKHSINTNNGLKEEAKEEENDQK